METRTHAIATPIPAPSGHAKALFHDSQRPLVLFAHEISNVTTGQLMHVNELLSGILELKDMQAQKGAASPRESELMQQIENAGQEIQKLLGHTTRLCHQSMMTGKILDPRYQLEQNKFNIGNFIQEKVVRVLDERQRGNQLIVRNPELNIESDKAVLEMLLANMVRNANQVSENSDITIELEFDQNSYLEVKVIDQGPGLGSDQIAKLFQFKSLRHDGSIYQGHGVGLESCHHLIAKLGGLNYTEENYIKVTSTVGAGSCFAFSFPAKRVLMLPPEQVTPEAAARPANAGGRGHLPMRKLRHHPSAHSALTSCASSPFGLMPYRRLPSIVDSESMRADNSSIIYVADDAPVNLRVIRIMLDRILPAGRHRIQCYPDGQALLGVFFVDKKAGRNQGMVMTDVGMPNKGGHNVLSEIRTAESAENTALHPIPVIAITGRKLPL